MKLEIGNGKENAMEAHRQENRMRRKLQAFTFTRGSCCRTVTLCALLFSISGCVTVADYRKLEGDVWALEQQVKSGGGGSGAPSGSLLADLTMQVEEMRGELAVLQGRLEVAERRVEQALLEAESARRVNLGAGEAPISTPTLPQGDTGASAAPISVEPGVEPVPPESSSVAITAEVQSYRQAYAAWSEGDAQLCIDRFREFLQNHPSSTYADDATYWIADCYFQQGDYKSAVLRFDDVVRRNPEGKKAADALFRQGETLLRMGPSYTAAASKAFERVLTEYPDSTRADDAKKQLELLAVR
jgi:tol-pal system protein YbgF